MLHEGDTRAGSSDNYNNYTRKVIDPDKFRQWELTDIDPEEDSPYSMTEAELERRAAKPYAGRYITQLYVGITVSVGALSYGCLIGWSNPAIKRSLMQTVNYNSDTYSYLASLVPLGHGIGTILLSYFSYNRGPRKVMVVITPFQIVFWFLFTVIENFQFESVMICFNAICSIGYMVCGNELLEDAVHSRNIPHLSMMYQCCVYIGVLLSYTMGMHARLEIQHTVTNLVILSIAFLLLYFCPESPVYLYKKTPVKAEKALMFFRGNDIHEALQQIKKDAEFAELDTSAKYMFFRKVVQRPLCVLLALNFFQAFTGYYAFIAYGFYIWNSRLANREKNFVVFTLTVDAAIVGCCYLVANTIAVYIHSRAPFGARKPLIISTFFTAVNLGLIAACLYFQNLAFIAKYPVIRLVLQASYICAYEIGLSTFPDLLILDYMPSQIFYIVRTIVLSFRWFLIYVMVHFTLWLQQKIGSFGSVALLASITAVGFVFCCLCIVESKGRTLLQIQLKYGGNPVGSRSVFRARHRQRYH